MVLAGLLEIMEHKAVVLYLAPLRQRVAVPVPEVPLVVLKQEVLAVLAAVDKVRLVVLEIRLQFLQAKEIAEAVLETLVVVVALALLGQVHPEARAVMVQHLL